MKLVYTAGPISSGFGPQMEINRLKAISVAYKLREKGYCVVCPHAESFFSESSLDYNGWIKHGLKLLSVCDECYILEGWEESEGTKIEIEFCIQNHIPMKYAYIDDCGELAVLDWECAE